MKDESETARKRFSQREAFRSEGLSEARAPGYIPAPPKGG
jgi:hypothetical protein